MREKCFRVKEKNMREKMKRMQMSANGQYKSFERQNMVLSKEKKKKKY
jgi:hypothetical protein